MSAHLNLSTGKFLNSSTLFKLSDALLLDLSSGEIVMSNLLVPRVGVDLFKLASLDLNFAQRKSLTDRVSGNNLVTFTRASTALYRGSDGSVKTAAVDAPRFDHDPVTGESLGLLIEEERTNLLTYSEQFDQWTKGANTTLTANVAVAPDGTQTADRMQNGSQSGTFIGNGTITNGVTYTVSVYAKAVTPGTNDTFTFNVGGNSENSSSQFTATSEWQRFVFTRTVSNASPTPLFFINNQGDGFASDIYIWGAQVEEGSSFPTSYIPTTSSTVTRAADVASITGTNFSSWYNQSEGTVFVEASAAGTAGVVGFNDGSTDRWRVGFAGDNNAKAAVIVGGVVQTNIVSPDNSTPYNQYHKLCIAIAENNLVFAYNGNALSDNSLSVPSVAGMTIGSAIGVPGRINGHVKRLAYFPTPKTEQESIGLTT